MKYITLFILVISSAAPSAELIITINGIQNAEGNLGCALFSSPSGFPIDVKQAKAMRQKAKPEPIECHFEGLAAGKYAAAVYVDNNENGKTDTNFVGKPTEPWGVSNNVRPTFRAPTFEEVALQLKDEEIKRIEITVSK